MRIEILSVAECPSHVAAVKLVERVLAAEGIVAEVREVLVANDAMASRLRFRGSPTIRIEGQDVSPETAPAEDCATSCRLYPGSGNIRLPAEEAVRRVVAAARAIEERP